MKIWLPPPLFILVPAMERDPVRQRRSSYAGVVPQKHHYATRSLTYNGLNRAGDHHAKDSGFVTPLQRERLDNFLPNTMNTFDTLGSTRNDSLPRGRRISRVAEEELTCSQQSILSDIDRFVRAVSNMDSTVLVPSRLQDIDPSSKETKLPANLPLENTDLVSFFTLVKEVKNELLWGTSENATLTQESTGHPRHPKHARQSSADTLGSTGSDQEGDSDLESVTTDRDTNEYSPSSHLALSFRHHLQALQAIMHQLTESADFLSSKYQESIDSLKP